jgi:ATP-dependent DNA helicase RecQ
MWFHLETYGGIDGEHAGLLEVARILDPAPTMRKLSLPFAGDQKGREKSLHRLTLLGVVGDYTVEWGSSEFIVTVNGVTPDSVINNLMNFVERSQPGRAEALSQRVNRDYVKVIDAIETCGLALMEFVYDTIERSRRRSLREMWLAARESASKGSEADQELRTRILDFLSEGDLMPGIEKLLDNQDFLFSNWQRVLNSLNSANDAREWRAATARLLASYPTHPGLLAGRALAEFVDPDGSLSEFEFNILLSLEESSKNYGAKYEDLTEFGKWLIDKAKKINPDGVGAVCAVLDYSGLKFEELDKTIFGEAKEDDIALSIIALNRKVNSALVTATNVLNQIY